MSHPIISTVLVGLVLHSVAAGQDAQLARGSVRILPVAQQVDRPQQADRRADQLGGQSIYGEDRHVVRDDGQLVIPDLTAPTTALEKIGSGSVPPAMEQEDRIAARPIPEGPDREGMWGVTAYHWSAPNTFSYPRYFEDAMLERHGHERFPLLQPMVSGARFFATVPLVPYLMAVRPPFDTEYTLGFYRPGSRAPALLQRPPYERKAVLVEAAAVLPFAL